jgi:hypothetical protein
VTTLNLLKREPLGRPAGADEATQLIKGKGSIILNPLRKS